MTSNFNQPEAIKCLEALPDFGNPSSFPQTTIRIDIDSSLLRFRKCLQSTFFPRLLRRLDSSFLRPEKPQCLLGEYKIVYKILVAAYKRWKPVRVVDIATDDNICIDRFLIEHIQWLKSIILRHLFWLEKLLAFLHKYLPVLVSWSFLIVQL